MQKKEYIVKLSTQRVKGGACNMKKKSHPTKEKTLEELYHEIIKSVPSFPLQKETYEGTLEQPHVLTFIETMTTYGAYQKPI